MKGMDARLEWTPAGAPGPAFPDAASPDAVFPGPVSPRPASGDVEIAWASAHDPLDVRLAVALPTFRRPRQVVETLRSVVSQASPIPFAVVVMENETQGAEGAAAARAFLGDHDVPAVVVLANRRGNCAAYNAGWHVSLERYTKLEWVLVIDDDELARPGWIATMLATAAATGADMVGAPQHPVFEAGSDEAMADHPVFRPPYERTGPVPILYSSGNVLIRADRLRHHGYPWLDEGFNFLGGGDSDFYDRERRRGARFAWCAQGGVDETIPARRTQLSWLNARALRNGTISALIRRRAAAGRADHARRVVHSLALLAASPWRSLWLAGRTRSPAHGLTHMNVALGRLLAEVGFANEQYRAADRN